MSAAKMVADSTQAEPTDTTDGKKKKKKVRKTGKKVSLPEDEDSDLDLKKELQPIGHYIKDRTKMVGEMFRAVKGASLQRALPDLLKSIPLDELRQLCLEQLEVMSKKRIRRILAGEESANISSSGTEDETTDEEMEAAFIDGHTEMGDPITAPLTEAQPADSTSVHQEAPSVDQEAPSKPEEPHSLEKQDERPATGFVSTFQQVEVKQEPPDSAEEEDMDHSDNDKRYDYPPDNDYPPEDEYDDEEDEDEEEEEEEEDIEANYTSGSEDGELVRREDQVKVNEEASSEQTVKIKQEPMSDVDDAVTNANMPSEGSLQTASKDTDNADKNSNSEEEGDEDDDEEEEEEEEQDGNSSLMRLSENSGGDMVLPSIMMDQMELLELEMRARAIKAMLSTQDGEDG